MQPVTMYIGPSRPYYTMVKKLLASLDVSRINEIRVDRNPGGFAQMQCRIDQRGALQVFIGGTRVGDFTDLYSLHQ